jgi:hypothetical protein
MTITYKRTSDLFHIYLNQYGGGIGLPSGWLLPKMFHWNIF